MKGELQYNTVGIKHIPFKLFGTAKIIKKADGDRIIAGYANLAVIDSQNQLISVEVLKAGMETLLADPAYANLMFTHKNIQIGKIINKYGNLETHVDDKGVYIIAEIRKDIETANQVWKQILKGELNGFSIGCEVLDEHKSCDVDGENCIDILDKIEPQGLAIAYMDDGTKHNQSRDFCFECFCYDEQIIFCDWLKDKFSIHASPIKYRDGFRTRIQKQFVSEFVNIIAPYILPSMKYKL